MGLEETLVFILWALGKCRLCGRRIQRMGRRSTSGSQRSSCLQGSRRKGRMWLRIRSYPSEVAFGNAQEQTSPKWRYYCLSITLSRPSVGSQQWIRMKGYHQIRSHLFLPKDCPSNSSPESKPIQDSSPAPKTCFDSPLLSTDSELMTLPLPLRLP